jgi:hypothetical protein
MYLITVEIVVREQGEYSSKPYAQSKRETTTINSLPREAMGNLVTDARLDVLGQLEAQALAKMDAEEADAS